MNLVIKICSHHPSLPTTVTLPWLKTDKYHVKRLLQSNNVFCFQTSHNLSCYQKGEKKVALNKTQVLIN